MSASVFTRSLLIAVAGVSFAGISLAQNGDTVVPTAEIETSPYTFAGEVNSDQAIVRSGPSENDYPTLKLAKGEKLVVVGYRFDWLKIEPPEGSFCLVSQAFVDKRGDGTVGRIANQRATVRVGSSLTLSKHKVPMQLEPGTDVKILGEVDEFYKIAPPKGVFMYVDKKFVNPVRKLDDNTATANNGNNTNPGGAPTGAIQPDTSGTTPPSITSTPPVPTTEDGKFRVVSSNDAATSSTGNEATTVADNTQPLEPAKPPVASIQKLQQSLAALEEKYTDAAQKDITEQPIDELLAGYNALLADAQLPPNARKVAEYRANALKLRKETLDQYLATKKMQAEIAQKQQDLKAEQDELQQRVEQTSVKRYTAIGRLVQSSLQIGNQTLYRLVDPATSRTIIYVRTAERPIVANLDAFVAIEGQVVADDAAKLTYIQPKKVDVVDPKQVNVKIFADYSPPSLQTQSVAGEPGQ